MVSKPVECRPTSHLHEWAPMEVLLANLFTQNADSFKLSASRPPTHHSHPMAGSFLIHFINGTDSIWGVIRWYPHSSQNANDGDGFLGKGIDAFSCSAISVGFAYFSFLLWNTYRMCRIKGRCSPVHFCRTKVIALPLGKWHTHFNILYILNFTFNTRETFATLVTHLHCV